MYHVQSEGFATCVSAPETGRPEGFSRSSMLLEYASQSPIAATCFATPSNSARHDCAVRPTRSRGLRQFAHPTARKPFRVVGLTLISFGLGLIAVNVGFAFAVLLPDSMLLLIFRRSIFTSRLSETRYAEEH